MQVCGRLTACHNVQRVQPTEPQEAEYITRTTVLHTAWIKCSSTYMVTAPAWNVITLTLMLSRSAPACTQVYLSAPACTQEYLSAPAWAQVYLSAPACTQVYLSAPACTQVYLSASLYTRLLPHGHRHNQSNMIEVNMG